MNYLSKHGEAKNSELLPLIGDFSLMTLHRDLNKLEEDGLIMRVHGGCIFAPLVQSRQELAFSYRINQNTMEKDEIARIAVDFIQPDRAYYFDAGSTVLSMSQLMNDEHHAIITSAPNIAVELSRSGSNTVTLLGGQVNNPTLSCSGPQSERMLETINIDVAVMATSGYSPRTGFSSGCMSESELKARVIQKSSLTVMLMDHTKISKNYPFTFAHMEDIDILVVDELSDDLKAAAEAAHVLVFSPDDGRRSDERMELFDHLLDKN